MTPFVLEPERYQTMVLTTEVCDCFGVWLKHATWLTAKEISGQVLVVRYSNIPTTDL